MMNFSFGYEGSSEEVDGKCSYGGMRGPCDRVASGGSRRIGSGCSFLGNVVGIRKKSPMQSEVIFGS